MMPASVESRLTRVRRSAGREAGQITLWVLGLSIGVLILGGISVDLWRVLAVRTELGSLADSAAIAGGSGIDEDVFRASPDLSVAIVLEDGRARALAAQVLVGETFATAPAIDVQPQLITVVLEREVEFTLLDMVVPGGSFTVRATGRSQPRPG